MVIIKSPIKWVGGKKSEIKYFEKYIPLFETYVEPFVGGGALFWHLKPKKAILNDINDFLTNFYIQLRDNRSLLVDKLQSYVNEKDYFKSQVEVLNSKAWNNDLEKAALFYYINKTCFSGKWRVNSKGKFNNTFGDYKKDHFKDLDTKYQKLLQGTEILNIDYKNVFDRFLNDENAFIFLDPPYLDCDTMYTESQKFEEYYKYILYFMRHCKCKVLLIVKENEYLINLFGDLIKEKYDKNYRHNATSTKIHNHLIICNY